jgi:hypothetical protein
MMKHDRWALTVIVVVACAALLLGASFGENSRPFQKGKQYRCIRAGYAPCTIKVVTPPDSTGWAQVKLLQEGGLHDHFSPYKQGDTFYIHLNGLFTFASEVQ